VLQPFTIGFQSEGDLARYSIRYMIKIAKNYTGRDWLESDVAPYDLLVCGGHDIVDTRTAKFTLRISQSDTQLDPNCFLKKNFSVQEFMESLKIIAEALVKENEFEDHSSVAHAGTSGWSQCATSVCESLLAQENRFMEIFVDGNAPIYLDFGARCYVSPDNLQQFCFQESNVQFNYITDSQFDISQFGRTRSLDELLWLSGLYSYRGVAAPWLRVGSSYRLLSWPNFASLAHDLLHLRLAAVMARSAVSAASLSSAVGCPVSQAQNFMNAVALMGLVRENNMLSIPPTRVSGRDPAVEERSRTAQTLFGRLRSRFGI
jgi:hypothetical protein